MKGESTTPKRQRVRETSVEVNDITGAIKKKHDAMPDVHGPVVAVSTQSPDLAKFMSAFGSLKGKGAFGDDAAEFQQEMREEWR